LVEVLVGEKVAPMVLMKAVWKVGSLAVQMVEEKESSLAVWRAELMVDMTVAWWVVLKVA
jgi:hypothetical protein